MKCAGCRSLILKLRTLSAAQHHYAILLCIFGMGMVLRVWGLGSESFWYDEIGSIDQATRSFSSLFLDFFQDPPLYPVLLRYWIMLFGISESAVRSLSVIIAAASLVLNYKIARLLFNKKSALLSTFLLAVSPFHIFYSQEGRYYILSFFLVLWSVFAFLKIIKGGNRRRCYHLAIINAALLLCNPLAFFIIVIENFLYLRYAKKHKSRWLFTQTFPLLALLLLWGAFVSAQLRADLLYFYGRISGLPKPSLGMLLETFEVFNYGGQRYGGSDIFVNYASMPYWAYIKMLNGIFALPAAYAGFVFVKKRSFALNHCLVIAWLLFPIAMLFLLRFIYVPRYVFFCLPAYYFLISAGIDRIKDRYAKVTIVFFMAMLLATAPLYEYYSRNLKIDWRGALAYVNHRLAKDDIVVLLPSKQLNVLGYYGKNGIKDSPENLYESEGLFREKPGYLEGPVIASEDGDIFIGVNSAGQFKRILREQRDNRLRNNDLWILATRWADEEEKAGIRRYARRFYGLNESEEFDGLEIEHYTLHRSSAENQEEYE